MFGDSMEPLTVKLGTRYAEFPSNTLQQLEPQNQLLGDGKKLRDYLNENGYLYLQGIHSREEVLEARMTVLDYINASGDNKLDPTKPLEDGVLNQNCGLGCVPFMEGKRDITHHPNILSVFEGDRVKKLFETIFEAPVLTFDYKWMRAMHRDGFTGAHVDSVYMSRGTQNLLTLWTPLGDITPDMGVLAVCEGSNSDARFEELQETYGNLDVEKENLKGTGWFTEDPFEITERFGGVWKTTSYKAGDVLVFTMRTVHMSTANLTSFARISCDTRWQASNEPVDMRYVGMRGTNLDQKFGVYASNSKEEAGKSQLTMEQLKSRWGFH